MVRGVVFAFLAGLAAAEPAFISSAFGNQVKLYEENSRGILTFRMTAATSAPVTFYAIETWANGTRYCSIRDGAYLTGSSELTISNRCAVPIDVRTGKAVEHASRLVEVRLANGQQWNVPKTVNVWRH